jgi:hypothetical protein
VDSDREWNERVNQLLTEQKLCVLPTYGKAGPYERLVAFDASQGLKEMLFMTPQHTHEYGHVLADARVAAMVESRKNEESDFHRAIAVTAVGNAASVTGEERETLVTRYLTRSIPSWKGMSIRRAPPSCGFA